MLTIFTSCLPFEGERDRIQRNALRSWMHLKPTPEVLIMGDRESGVKEFAREFSDMVRVIDVDYTDFGVPFFNSIFKHAYEEARFDVLCYTNTDVIHLPCLMDAVRVLRGTQFKEYVVTGQRYDVDIGFDIDFNGGYETELRRIVKESGVLVHPSGCDYFVFPKSMSWSHMPGFAQGRTCQDTWICGDTLNHGIPLVSATSDVMVIHQKHGRSREVSASFEAEKARNIRLTGSTGCGSDMATYVLVQGRVVPKPLVDYYREKMYCYNFYSNVPGQDPVFLKKGYSVFSSWYPNCEMEHKEWWVKNIRPDWVIIDAGANIGVFSVLFGRMASKVYAFEPTDTVEILRENLGANGLTNVEVVPLALGKEKGIIRDSVFKIWGEPPEIRQYVFTTIDDFVREKNIKIDAIKIDVDSYEYELLLGAENTLVQQSPYVTVEVTVDALAIRNIKPDDIKQYMEKLGYRCMKVFGENHLFVKNG